MVGTELSEAGGCLGGPSTDLGLSGFPQNRFWAAWGPSTQIWRLPGDPMQIWGCLGTTGFKSLLSPPAAPEGQGLA